MEGPCRVAESKIPRRARPTARDPPPALIHTLQRLGIPKAALVLLVRALIVALLVPAVGFAELLVKLAVPWLVAEVVPVFVLSYM